MGNGRKKKEVALWDGPAFLRDSAGSISFSTMPPWWKGRYYRPFPYLIPYILSAIRGREVEPKLEDYPQ